MTESGSPVERNEEATLGSGVLPEYEGVILQRGGEELSLEKVGDRFTARLVPGHSPETLAQRIQAESFQPIASVDLVEFRVDPSQLDQAMQVARASDEVVFASHIYQLQGRPNTVFYLTNQITILFSDTVNRSTIGSDIAGMGLLAVKAVPGVPQAFVFQLDKQATANPIKLANQLMRRADVLTAEPNVVIPTQLLYRPRDPEYPKQWHLHHNGGPELAAGSHISAEAAWDITRGVRSVVVAVADDGFDLNHPDFQGKGKIVFPRDLKGKDFLPLAEGEEDHGTACAGVAIAEENGIGTVGVAPGCTFMPIRTTMVLSDQAIEEIFNWAIEKGADVISCSWGPSSTEFPLSLRQRAVINRAATKGRNGKGCVVVFAAGNSNRPINGMIDERGWPRNALRGPTKWLNGYASHPDVIAVSACTSLNKKAVYSNWGTGISICAPSDNARPKLWFEQFGNLDTGPTISATLPGRVVWTSDRLGPAGRSGDFTEFGGTSSACPVIAGVAALVLSVNPNLTAREVKQILQDTADKIRDDSLDLQLGYRKGSYNANGHSEWFGYGKVNAFKAVKAAQQRLAQAPSASRRIQEQNTTPVNIPDFNPQGVISAIRINDAGILRDIQVSVDIEHSFMGDVEITLIPPKGDKVLLQSRTLGRLTHLQTIYTVQTTPLLRQLLNQPVSGAWRLQLVDHAQLNTGRLKSWQLNLGV
jgi:subtilisin family serine protease/subtilisin-like proprotein convertase family protein